MDCAWAVSLKMVNITTDPDTVQSESKFIDLLMRI